MKQGIGMTVLLLLLALTQKARAEKLMIISDLHLTQGGEEPFSQVLPALILAAQEADAVLLLGDNTNNGRPEEHQRMTAYLAGLAADTGKPIYVLPGNHDLSGRFALKAFADAYADFGYRDAVFRHAGSLSYAAKTPGGTWLVMLDLNRYDEKEQADAYGWVSDSLLAWLRETLDKTDPAQTVVCAHYPIQPVLTETVRDGEKLFSLLAREGTRVYLCGHRHTNDTMEAGGVRQITVGMPQGYPCLAGWLENRENRFIYTAEPLFDSEDAWYTRKREETLRLGRQMAEGSLKGTRLEGDEGAVSWFAEAFMAYSDGTLPEKRDALLRDENAEKWRQTPVRYVTRSWIFSLLETGGESVRRIEIP